MAEYNWESKWVTEGTFFHDPWGPHLVALSSTTRDAGNPLDGESACGG